jgi:hypothetical protein
MRGFALVATLSLMVLLAILAVGLLSLSAVSLRSAGQGSAQAEARANARMALMVAIGELQKHIGPDQRITANGAILDDPTTSSNEVLHPHWTGVWNSWKAGDGTSFHRSVEGESLMGMAPTYLTGRNDYFRSWLLSLDPDEASDWEAPKSLNLTGVPMPTKDQDAILLVGEGSLGEDAEPIDFVSARLIDVNTSGTTGGFRGRYGWWVGDQAQKARVMGDSYEKESTLTLAQKIARAQAPGSTGSKTIEGLEEMTDLQETKLEGLPSLKTLDVVIADNDKIPAQANFHAVTPFSEAVIADVREGGLKRDLSTLLELPIDPAYVSNEYLLYKFNTKNNSMAAFTSKPQEIVPIHDLAAFYQLYDAVTDTQDPLRKSNARGVQYKPHNTLGGIDGPHIRSTNYGTTKSSPIYPREYSANYRQPRIIKVQFLASLFSKKIEPTIPADRTNPQPNTHELLIGITPSITLWNPTNLPAIFQMKEGDVNMAALTAQMMRLNDLPLRVKFNKNNNQHITADISFNQMCGANYDKGNSMLNLYWAGIHPIKMEPGEVKTLSLPFSGDVSSLKATFGYKGHWAKWNTNFFGKTDTYFVGHEVKVGWEPESFMHFTNSANPGTNNGNAPANPARDTDTRHVVDGRLRFKSSDRIGIVLGSGGAGSIGWGNNSSCYQDFNPATSNWDRWSGMMNGPSGQALFSKGMTGGATELKAPSRTGASIIARSTTDAGWPFMHFSYMAGVETNEASNGGGVVAGGRKFASRPFLHSSPINSFPYLDGNTGNALYNFGWNWAIDLINDVYQAPVQVTPTGSGYWGGGYTNEYGTTHIIQQEIPVVPPLSIAALSHARLGGWSISDQAEMTYDEMNLPTAGVKRLLMRAIGFGGLAPNTLQAIGNSYAHPLIPANLAHTNTTRAGYAITFADHSYLANKALWDEYFFSSITPQRTQVEVFEASDRTVDDVANQFFFDNERLPNRRITPYMANMNDSKLADILGKKDLYENGMADEIAAHLMVEGPFNINSTSVEAWKIFFSSLKKKPVPYVDRAAAMAGGNPVLAENHDGVPVSQTGLGGGAPYSGSPDSPRNANQWTSSRSLTDAEIEELAEAMVKQVKLRGPFLSLSEFVNRRLDSAKPELAVKGALQAALDDPDVSINAAFRTNERKFSASEISSMNPAFPLAAEGPVAYGSSAYIDQADVLRGFAEQITPRGDTFVIRTYGDSIDAGGKVAARAWCEAVVQRVPEYVDGEDEPFVKAANLASDSNKSFGRKIQIISFRWLNPSEV